ncbi:ATP-dependent helicase [Amnibacterium kyonggiense]|uniref:ATP-dependent helicase n=1 Tax=Amnibacterium kyonggiense TaxID=595671 RepID=UPI0013C2D71A|nr:ATP-dependent DNA helicase [Amnibacterium kyonggiense]
MTAVLDQGTLDADQRAVLALPVGASAVVLGAPGTGRTTTAVALVADRIGRRLLEPEEVLLVAPRRAQASRLRDRLLLAVGRPVSAPLARTAASLAFDIARRDAAEDGRDTPVLLSGGDQDRLIGQLLPDAETAWPERLGADVRSTRAFRGELRELFARCTERDVTPDELADLGAREGREEWSAAAAFWREYLEVLPAVEPDAFDSAELVAIATAAVLQGRPGALAGRLRLVVVDDLQDLGESAVGLLAALAARGCAIVAFGDPDVASDTFRGGEPDLLGRFEQRFGVASPARIVLGTVHRHPETVRRFVSAVTARIGTALAGTQRTATARPGGEPVRSVEADGPGALAARIAHLLRERHLEHDVPFADQAVVVRSNALVEPLARALEIAGVPAVTTGTAIDATERAPRALVEVVAVALGILPLTPESAAALVTGPFCGLDRLALRRLRLALRVEELDGGGARSAGELLVEALAAPGRLATIDTPFARRAARLAETMQAVRALDAAGASAEDLLWHVWDASGLAPVWRERALGAGLVAAEANRDLDDLVALFASAARAAERGPTDPAAGFISARLEADVAEDSLAPRGLRDGVLVTTPVGVAGLEFDTVVVAGLQDGVWPNLRPRGSLLGLGDLVARLDGRGAPASPVDERRAVLSDELRLFALAASRARSVLLLAAIANDDEAPSVLLGLADGPAPDGTATAPNALRPLVGLLRRTAVTGGEAERAEAASALARLARAEVPGAAPSGWWGLAAPSTTEPLVPDPEQPVRVSPSKLERFEESPLDWFLERVAGGEPMLAGAIGTMLHWVLETATSPDEASLLAALEGRWRELDFEAAWVEEREHRLANRMIGAISRYLADVAAERAELIGGETAFEFPVGRALATGTIDRIERDRDGRVRVVDLKTGSTRPSAAETARHAQLGVYQLAVRAGVVEGVSAEAATTGAALLYVRQKTKDPYTLIAQQPLDEEAAAEFRSRLAAAAEGMAGATFEGPVEPDVRFGSSPFRPMLLRVPDVCGG